jgi:hypothetical protein
MYLEWDVDAANEWELALTRFYARMLFTRSAEFQMSLNFLILSFNKHTYGTFFTPCHDAFIVMPFLWSGGFTNMRRHSSKMRKTCKVNPEDFSGEPYHLRLQRDTTRDMTIAAIFTSTYTIYGVLKRLPSWNSSRAMHKDYNFPLVAKVYSPFFLCRLPGFDCFSFWILNSWEDHKSNASKVHAGCGSRKGPVMEWDFNISH